MAANLYHRLDHLRREIRLITIKEGAFDDPIECDLNIVSLDEGPTYEALSYVWGEPGLSGSILIGERKLGVTDNLKVAMLYLRRLDVPRTMWIDAVCIDQSNVAERGRQVALMADIFRDATGTIAWLGKESSDSRLAFDGLEALSAEPSFHWRVDTEPSFDAEYLSRQCLQSICALLNRPWWHRLWTVQESILPRRLVFLCGWQELPSQTLFKVNDNFTSHSSSCRCVNQRMNYDGDRALAQELEERLASVKLIRWSGYNVGRGLSLLDFLYSFQHRLCRDPRDKVYALLGLGKDTFEALLEPDYSKPSDQVFEEAAVQLIARSRRLDILSYILPTFPASSPDPRSPMRCSWAPNWRVEGVWQDLMCTMDDLEIVRIRNWKNPMYSASGKLESSARYLGGGKLAVRAIILGTIAEVSETRNRDSKSQLLSSWRQLAQVDRDGSKTYPLLADDVPSTAAVRSLETMRFSDAYWLTICASIASIMGDPGDNGVARYYGVIADLPPSRLLHDCWWAVLEAGGGHAPWWLIRSRGVSEEQVRDFDNSVLMATYARRLFLTGTSLGLIGLAPHAARPGDAVALLEGGSVPVILREASDVAAASEGAGAGSKFWRAVGDAYVQGIMNSEGLALGTMADIVLV